MRWEIEDHGMSWACEACRDGDGETAVPRAIGTEHEPRDFMVLACGLRHPIDRGAWLPPCLATCIFEHLTDGYEAIVRKRRDTLDKFTKLAGHLQAAEDRMHAALPAVRSRVIKGKRFLLLQHMAAEAGVPDPGLALAGYLGCAVVGTAPNTGQFEPVQVEPTLSVEGLQRAAKWNRKVLEARVKTTGRRDLDQRLWDLTLDEVSRGWLEGPFSAEQLDERHGPLWVACPRFPLEQRGKVRAIDDGTACMVNAAHAPTERLTLGGVDEVVGIARAFLDGVSADGRVEVACGAGVPMRGTLHPDLVGPAARGLRGRTLDLQGAYRQLLTGYTTGWANNVVVWDPDAGRPVYFIAHAMLFGTAASVMGFNRFSRALWQIGVRLFHLAWSNYVDDFPHISMAADAQNALDTSKEFLDLLGWTVATDGAKDMPMAEVF